MAADSVRIMGILLQPFMPERMQVGLNMIGVDETRRSFEYARLGADLDYGTNESSEVGGGEGKTKTKAEAEALREAPLFPTLLSSH
jgi:methionyl-tRNA synthetase